MLCRGLQWALAIAASYAMGMAAWAADRAPGTWRQAYAAAPAAIRFDLPLKGVPPAPAPLPATLRTVRERVTVAIGGSQLRVRISNEEGDKPLTITAASIALAADAFHTRGTIAPLTFGGLRSATVPPGAPLVSDPVPLRLAPMTDLVISLASQETGYQPSLSLRQVAVADGDQTHTQSMANERSERRRALVTGVSVWTTAPAKVIVALGDSITDGSRRSPTSVGSWPEWLQQRLAARTTETRHALLNSGIAGNRILANGVGQAALARFDRDVLAAEGITHVIVLEGTNDIGAAGASGPTGVKETLDAKDLIFAYRQMIARAKAHGIKIILGTITPFGGAKQASAEREAFRQAVNTWIRTSGEPDGVIDFDAAVRDPADPGRMLTAYDSGDHLHPSEAGQRAMADKIDLNLLR